jgi:N-methylhydantoinase A
MAYFGQAHGLLKTAVVGRGEVSATPTLGPLVVEEYDATTIVPPNCTVWRDRANNLVIEVDHP